MNMIEEIYLCRKNYQASDFKCFSFRQGFPADLIALTLKMVIYRTGYPILELLWSRNALDSLSQIIIKFLYYYTE